MTLDEKILIAENRVRDVVSASKNPIIACSFGKDSMVMMDLIRKLYPSMPVLYLRREVFFPREKQSFAHRMTEEMNLPVYEYPPTFTSVKQKDDLVEVVNHYMIGHDSISGLSFNGPKYMAIPSGTYSPEPDKSWLCAYEDMYKKPVGLFAFPWDAVFSGHKDSDVDPVEGAVPLASDTFKTENAPLLSFPIRHFRDDDVWEYTRRFSVPQDGRRYADPSDMTYNNDYFPACTECLNRNRPEQVWCPKKQQLIQNISGLVKRSDGERPSYWQKAD